MSQLIDLGLDVEDRISIDPTQEPIAGARQLWRRLAQDGAERGPSPRSGEAYARARRPLD
jgi:hypothetical protein